MTAPGEGPSSAAPGGARSAPVARVLVRALARRPWLWPDAAMEAVRLAPPGWWRRWPPLPLPDEALWRFRMETAYGGRGDQVPDGHDVVRFIGWCRDMGRWRSR
ncbi:MAG TPA: hypothetical protein VLZ77_05770 [Acidimicrobiales bacterium]|nr:hypothetical protein [Acidimicrobiales bacterium]